MTETGRAEFLSWLRELLSEPAKEYTQFAAGLSFVAAVPPAEAAELLRRRVRLLEGEVEEMRSHLGEVAEQGLPRLFLVESEHELILRDAELSWVRGLVREIEDGTLDGLEQWESLHAEREMTDASRDVRGLGKEDA